MRSEPGFDLAVVGAGIVGLACALAAVRRGKTVVVIDRDAQANGASVRNFGFITITGQARGAMWSRAHRSRVIWEEVAQQAGIPVLHRGLTLAARRPESLDLISAFLDTEMGEGCKLLEPAEALARQPGLSADGLLGALWSPHELRVESREAIPGLAHWLEQQHGVVFRRGEAALSIESGKVLTTRGRVEAEAVAVCPGDDLYSLFPEQIAAQGVRRCKLQMLRLADPGFRLQGGVMSDLGLERYEGYGALPQARPLRARLQQEQPDHLANGVHLIVVQSADGSLVVGDSHHYAPTPDPFASQAVDQLILDEFAAVFGAVPPVQERWTGTYAHIPGKPLLIETPMPGVRLVMVTTGAGASTGFAIGEQVVEDLFEGTRP
jgi:FAD dependent oxidoreductase TIGR03364